MISDLFFYLNKNILELQLFPKELTLLICDFLIPCHWLLSQIRYNKCIEMNIW